jgi:hypothetical protein
MFPELDYSNLPTPEETAEQRRQSPGLIFGDPDDRAKVAAIPKPEPCIGEPDRWIDCSEGLYIREYIVWQQRVYVDSATAVTVYAEQDGYGVSDFYRIAVESVYGNGETNSAGPGLDHLDARFSRRLAATLVKAADVVKQANPRHGIGGAR